MGTALVLLWIVIVMLLPATLASYRKHPNTLAIGVLGLLLGWTGIAWLGAWVWACTGPGRRGA